MRRLMIVFAFVLTACASPPAHLDLTNFTPPFQDNENDALLIGAGDIAKCVDGQPSNAAATAAIIMRFQSAKVFTAGDNAYEEGSRAQFTNCYDKTWGAFANRTYPAPGNHDHRTPALAGYYGYFPFFAPPAARTPYYSFDVKDWHIVSLDSDSDADPGILTTEEAWLDADLANSRKRCVAAIWHHPLFSSGIHGSQGGDPGRRVGGLWRVLLKHHADLVINGHDHDYERFAPQDATGTPSTNGLRQFVIGTGGGDLRPFAMTKRNSEFRDRTNYGVLLFALDPNSYEWAFITTTGVIGDKSAAPESCHSKDE